MMILNSPGSNNLMLVIKWKSVTVRGIEDGSALIVADIADFHVGGDLTIGDGTLAGDGSIEATNIILNDNGTLSPGASPGTLRLVGDLTMNPGSIYFWQAT
jgi:hypothetical protein